MMRRLLVALVLLANMMLTVAQQIKTVEGYARMEVGEDMTMRDAKRKVCEMARFDAIEKTFGTNITKNSVTYLRNDSGKSKTHVYMRGESDLRGRWIKDLKEPKYKRTSDEESRDILECWVKGHARERMLSDVRFEWKLLANGTDDRFETETGKLYDGEPFYVKFRSPVKGYLMIFMVNEEDNDVYSIIPEEGEDYCQVAANKWQLYIYDPDRPWHHSFAMLPENRSVEHDQLYVIFSKKQLTPPVCELNKDGSDLNRYSNEETGVSHMPQLTFEAFQKYLGRILSDNVQMEKMHVEILKRK